MPGSLAIKARMLSRVLAERSFYDLTTRLLSLSVIRVNDAAITIGTTVLPEIDKPAIPSACIFVSGGLSANIIGQNAAQSTMHSMTRIQREWFIMTPLEAKLRYDQVNAPYKKA
jgi:hypothetical protein